MGLVKEFKTFINQGNVVDLAVGVVIGAAFGKIVSSFVDDIISPLIGLMIGETNFGDLKYVMKEAVLGADGKETSAAVSLNYGSFLEAIIDFVIVAAAIFMVVKAMNNMKKKEAQAPSAPTPPPAQEVLLTEIRDLLKK
ncbi:MAG: large-conductance mechanosensitive channel protein MscL [Bacteroidetes bacterium]|nr:large-conductance mechanosensitive channel protein MscL [Bacteroidota bacterium]